MFSRPFNWCDRRCERCPLSPGCELRWFAEREFPDGVHPLTDEVLREIEREERELLHDLPPPPAMSDREKRVMEVIDAGEMSSLEHYLVAAKLARIGDQLDDPPASDLYVFDTVPNLLLLERLIDELPEATARALRDELGPVFDGIDVELRRAMAAMVEAGVAPSPFCVRDVGPDVDAAT
jgi:hypothetical protein